MAFTDAERIKEIAGLTVEWMRKLMAKAPETVPPHFTLITAAWDIGYNSVTWISPVLIVAFAPKEVTTGIVDMPLALSYLDPAD